MKDNKKIVSEKQLEDIWKKVPVNYYQAGIKNNIFQRLYHKGRTRSIIETLQTNGIESGKVLDVGCASGWLLSEIASEFPNLEYLGIDVYKKALAYGRQTYPNIRFILADAHTLPFSKKSFDIVTCINVLEHVINPEKIMREIHRVLRPNSVAIIGMDSENVLFRIIWLLWTKMNGRVWKHTHLHRFTPKALEKLFQKTGFTVRKKSFYNVGLDIIYLLSIP